MSRPRSALVISLAVLAASGLLAEARTSWDGERRVGRWAADLPDALTTPLEVVMQTGTLVAVVLVAAGLVVAGRYRAAAAAAAAGLGGRLAASALKAWTDRPRPSLASLGRAPREIVDHTSWPSSHVTIAAALATVLLLTLAKGRLGRGVVISAAALTAVARLHLGAHWGLDVVGGAALGTTAGLVAVNLTRAT